MKFETWRETWLCCQAGNVCVVGCPAESQYPVEMLTPSLLWPDWEEGRATGVTDRAWVYTALYTGDRRHIHQPPPTTPPPPDGWILCWAPAGSSEVLSPACGRGEERGRSGGGRMWWSCAIISSFMALDLRTYLSCLSAEKFLNQPPVDGHNGDQSMDCRFYDIDGSLQTFPDLL